MFSCDTGPKLSFNPFPSGEKALGTNTLAVTFWVVSAGISFLGSPTTVISISSDLSQVPLVAKYLNIYFPGSVY